MMPGAAGATSAAMLLVIVMLAATALAFTRIAGATDLAAEVPRPLKSGAEFMGESSRVMQRDDTQNPAMLWVGDGEALWGAKPAADAKACADCHGSAGDSMRGVAAGYPRYQQQAGRVLTLGQRINLCRERQQQASAFKAESADLLGLESYVALQSRGMPLAPAQDKETRAAADAGRAIFHRRIGQLNLSCAQCHDSNWGRKLAGAPIPQGHANAYPIYRLEWQSVGSLQRRLRNCMSGVRADVPSFGDQDLVRLEAYLAVRAAGMALESPGVRP
jgi:L-cysteine S-thiosulfotransferase